MKVVDAGTTEIEASVGSIVMLNSLFAVCAGLLASLTCNVILNVPAAVGVPPIEPLVVLSVKPGGNAPPMIDHAYGVVPPLAARVDK